MRRRMPVLGEDDDLVGEVSFCRNNWCFEDNGGKEGNKSILEKLAEELGFDPTRLDQDAINIVVEGIGKIRIRLIGCIRHCNNRPIIVYTSHNPYSAIRANQTFDWQYFLREVKKLHAIR